MALYYNLPIYKASYQLVIKLFTSSDDFALPASFCIGGDCQTEDVNGTIDEMRVYSQSLQSGEIEKIYADELPAHLLADKVR
jgi:hypothetical protein